MEELLSAIFRGMSFGCVYALLAVGLVLTYKTSGVFNLAFGAQAFASAAIYYEIRVHHEWPILVALVVSVFVAAPLLGVALDRLLFRHLRTAPPMARLVTTLGLLVAIPETVKLIFDQGSPHGSAVGIVPDGLTVYRPFGDVFLSRDDLATIVATMAVAIALTVVFRATPVGLRMRAVVESPRMTELAGVNADRVSTVSWMLSSFLAGLAGVLLAPIFSQVVDHFYTTLVIAAIFAAVLGSLQSIPIAFVGGLLLGVLQQTLAIYLPTNSVLATNLRPSLPFVALFLVLAFSPALRHRREASDPLAAVDPPPKGLAAAERSDVLTAGTRLAAVLFLGGVGYYVFFVGNPKYVNLATSAAIYAVIFLSITVITGMAGQVSLCQATFAGIGAFATAQLATELGMSVLVAMLFGAALTAAIGALLAIPALRLGGIFLSLLTLGFALFFDNVMIKFPWVTGGNAVVPTRTPRPLIGPIDFASDKSFLVLACVILAVVAVVVILVREGTTGRYLDALRGSEVAASSIGINATRARITAFALAAGIAGLGGGLLAMKNEAANYQASFLAPFGMFWVVIVVSLGPRTVEGAIQAGIGFIFFPELVLKQWIPWIVNNVQPWYEMDTLPLGLQFVFFGLGAITYARHPEGVLEHSKRRSLARVQRRIDRTRAGRRPADATTAGESA